MSRRRNHYDVTGRIRISHPNEVLREVERLFDARFDFYDRGALRLAFDRFARLYAGWLPGWVGCDTRYHDAQHSLDCALATARLIDGHEQLAPEHEQLGAARAVLGLIIALFHDVGYVRRKQDAADNGAAFTLSHVERSAQVLRELMPQFGLGALAGLAGRIVHFTGYEMPLDSIDVREPRDRMLGFLIASADLLAQTADRCYLEKCRDFLFEEFERCGLAGERRPGGPEPRYRDRDELLSTTPDFNRHIWQDRLDGYFGGVHRYLAVHFHGRTDAPNPYVESIRANLARVDEALARGAGQTLRLKPDAIRADALRQILDAEQPTRPVLRARAVRKRGTPAGSGSSTRRSPRGRGAVH